MSNITLNEVNQEAIDAIKLLKEGRMDVKQAQAIKGLLDTVVDTAKTQVEFLKALPNGVKESFTPDQVKSVAGTLRNKDAEMDEVMKEIEEKNKRPYTD
jgi:hypothetical protein